MEIGYTEEHQALRNRLREYYAALLTPEVEAQLADSHGIGPHMRRVVKQMAEDGWLGIGWPTEYGGQGLGAIEQYIFFDESMRAGAPVPMLTINTVGPTIMDFGTEEQKDFFLPKILAGDIHFCIGYTEPECRHRPGRPQDPGRTRRRRVRHQRAEDLHLAGRRGRLRLAGDPHRSRGGQAQGHLDVHRAHGHPGHQGGAHAPDRRAQHQHTFYDDVRVPAANLVGGENNGWSLITNQLNHERVTLCSSGVIERALDDVRAWAQDTKLADGRRVIDQEWVQINLARVHARLEFLKLINWKVAWTATQGHLDVADASTTKVFGTEFYMEAFRLMLEVVGQAGYLHPGQPRRGAGTAGSRCTPAAWSS